MYEPNSSRLVLVTSDEATWNAARARAFAENHGIAGANAHECAAVCAVSAAAHRHGTDGGKAVPGKWQMQRPRMPALSAACRVCRPTNLTI